MVVYGGADTNGSVLDDIHVLEFSAAPKWSMVQQSASACMPGPRLSPTVICTDDPDVLGLLVFGGKTPGEGEDLTHHNDLFLIEVDEETQREVSDGVWSAGDGEWNLLYSAQAPFSDMALASATQHNMYVHSATTVEKKKPGHPQPLGAINEVHELTPSSLMNPSTPEKPEIVRELGNACVLSWDTISMCEGDLFTNQYFLEVSGGTVKSPYLQIYSGPNTTFHVKNLDAGTEYTFRVRASNGARLSAYSEECIFEAGDQTEEVAPTGTEFDDEQQSAEDWYEQWLEEEKKRQEDEMRERVRRAQQDKMRRAQARQMHEEILDMHVLSHNARGEEKQRNSQLHAEMWQLLQDKRGRNSDMSQGNEPTRNFGKVLQDVTDRLRELEMEEENKESLKEQMQARLDHKVAAAELVHTRFHTFKREIAMEAENSRTGKKIPERQLGEIENNEKMLDDELNTVRLRNIVLKHELARLESWLQSKEVLGEGLHLIDFEQLKIENQTLNEKIEERNEELLKLRKKNTQTVQVLTHIKEKLQFVQADNQLQKDRLADLETDLAVQRDLLAGEKKNLDTIRQDRVKLKEKSGLVDSDDLLYDFEKTKDRIGELRDELNGLQDRRKSVLQSTNQIITTQQVLSEQPGYGDMM